MSEKFKIFDDSLPHFVTFTVVKWIDLFTRNEYRKVIIDNLKYCQKNKELVLYAYCIMTNHIHLILSSRDETKLGNTIRDFRGFTSKTLLNAIENNPGESRKDWLLKSFKREGSKRKSNKTYQLWKRNYHPIELDNLTLIREKIEYIHQNPVKAGFVFQATDYVFSSASNYSGKKGLIEITNIF
ncbi:MAG: transposase [Bacteroidetes bacterium]|jgi:REP element-mobilizing transposase RayT|nr:transposase [Bacteroidota bacterium]